MDVFEEVEGLSEMLKVMASDRHRDPVELREIASTYQEPHRSLPPLGALVRVKKDCNVCVYAADDVRDVAVKQGDMGIVESHGAVINGTPKLARVRLFRVGELAAVSLKSINGERWEVIQWTTSDPAA